MNTEKAERHVKEIQQILLDTALEGEKRDLARKTFEVAAGERDGAEMDRQRAILHEILDNNLDKIARLKAIQAEAVADYRKATDHDD